jgi:transposase
MTGEGREWLACQPLPETAREQVTVALAMIDALEVQIAPLNKELRAYARRQAGCRALMAHYGIGELTAVTILAELGDCTRFSSSRHAVRYAGMEEVRGRCSGALSSSFRSTTLTGPDLSDRDFCIRRLQPGAVPWPLIPRKT